MVKLLKWIGIVIGLLLLVGGGVALTGWLQADRKMERRIDVSVATLALPSEPAAIERGRYLFNSRGCAECHGADGGGRKVIDGGGMLVISPHISAGPGRARRRRLTASRTGCAPSATACAPTAGR